MKRLTIYTLFFSVLISLIYSFKVYWLVETDAEFYRATTLTFISEFGLWCVYYYARDYEAIKAHEEHAERLKKMLEK